MKRGHLSIIFIGDHRSLKKRSLNNIPTTSQLPPRRYFAVRLLDSAELGACAFFADRLPAQYWFGLHQEDGPMV